VKCLCRKDTAADLKTKTVERDAITELMKQLTALRHVIARDTARRDEETEKQRVLHSLMDDTLGSITRECGGSAAARELARRNARCALRTTAS